MNPLLHPFVSKGIRKALYRIWTVTTRFGFSPRTQQRYLSCYIDLLQKYSAKATFFIPALLIKQYHRWLPLQNQNTIEWGIHGYSHIDMSGLSSQEASRMVCKACSLFDKYHVPFYGFRAPYLQTGQGLLAAIETSGRFLYNSSNTIIWDEVYFPHAKHAPWAREFYHPQLHSHPMKEESVDSLLLNMPVSLPDDDLLYDRERWSSTFILNTWQKILTLAHTNNELFVMQLHPERIYALKETLESLLIYAQTLRPRMWIASLSEIAQWQKNHPCLFPTAPEGYQGIWAITGDIDALTIQDFFRRRY